jgi:hypothetical protein
MNPSSYLDRASAETIVSHQRRMRPSLPDLVGAAKELFTPFGGALRSKFVLRFWFWLGIWHWFKSGEKI